jgi:membrane protease YdiL (CAAX protease family)
MKTFLAQFGILFGLGILGIVALIPTQIPLLQQQLRAYSQTDIPPLWVILISINLPEVLLLIIAVSVGIFCTPPLALSSRLIDKLVVRKASTISLAQELKWSLGVGLSTAVLVLGLDWLMTPLLPKALQSQAATPKFYAIAGIFHGGLTEEILMRWGLMSFLVWALWKIFKRGTNLPSRWIYQAAILIAALLFGLGHLPATAALVPLTPFLIGRAVLLNGIVGIGYGWLFWQYSLEAAMIAHISFHVLSAIVSPS